MKKHQLVWIPFFGLFFDQHNPFIIFHMNWLIYQCFSTIAVALILAMTMATTLN